ncbi:MAG TPA: efflux RND transporter periplasmic adaptor subunit [Acidobacteriota bacterium]|nr:efflux RND transporter periplasmic adaptor subunit [bacterium]HNX19528.1 efflux RND transporter periplasmic adaptor subunit [Acidobacteriota bacterium]
MSLTSAARALAAAGLVVAALGAASCAKPAPPAPPPPTVVVVEAIRKDVPIRGEWVGQTIGESDVAVRPRVDGAVLGIHFQEGGGVAKGQVLYTLEDSKYKELVASAEADLARANTVLARADADLARIRPLAEMNAVSRKDLDAATADRKAAAEGVESARAMLNVAKINLGYTRVEAPITGLAGISRVRVGDYVSPAGANAVLDTISTIDPIHVRFFLSEAQYLAFLRAYGLREASVQTARAPLDLILADGSVHPHVGRVVKVDRGIDPTAGALAVEASFPNPEKTIRPGQFAKVRAVVDERKGAILVPERAVQELQGRAYVFVVGADGAASFRAVKTGPRVEGLWVVEEGLAAGETVVAEGGQRLRTGMKVAATKAPAGK